MGFTGFDYVAFVGFIAVVIFISLYASRKQESSEDYFLAGRGLPFWLIGFSLIASNISTEHFVGMAGEGYGMGLAIASYEWIAAITLVLVALYLLPRFLKSGIFTIPEFLEYRYNAAARAIMAVYMMAAFVLVAIATVLYSGALALNTIFGIDLVMGIWLIGVLAGAYTIYGGLKAVVWSDLIQGAAGLSAIALTADAPRPVLTPARAQSTARLTTSSSAPRTASRNFSNETHAPSERLSTKASRTYRLRLPQSATSPSSTSPDIRENTPTRNPFAPPTSSDVTGGGS